MENAFLIKYGEISLKGKNRPYFERKLVDNIKRHLAAFHIQVILRVGRIYVYCREDEEAAIREELARIFGVISFAPTVRCDKTFEDLCAAGLVLAREALASRPRLSFKIEARRTDKSFPLSSYQIACDLADYLIGQCPGLSVNVRNPDWLLSVEVRERAYLYGPLTACLRGLPVGCSGRGLLLLSGGIDSPVAGFLMAKRGIAVEAVYFHTPPFTPEGAREKVIDLVRSLKNYIPGIRLTVVDFTAVQTAIKEKAFHKAVTLMSRAAMMQIAERIARRRSMPVLITGECLGQVASQTPESLAFTESYTDMPVLRPLIGLDKTEIIELARRIGTFDISTRPFADCCTLFAPEHPIIRPDRAAMRLEFAGLGLDELMEQAALAVSEIEFNRLDQQREPPRPGGQESDLGDFPPEASPPTDDLTGV
jgi:tRNA uracil 4-sulfurtransferase